VSELVVSFFNEDIAIKKNIKRQKQEPLKNLAFFTLSKTHKSEDNENMNNKI
jgi:hypothetical protein